MKTAIAGLSIGVVIGLSIIGGTLYLMWQDLPVF